MRAPRWIVPALAVACAAAGVGGARLFVAPSVTREFAAAAPGAATRKAKFVVNGIRCVDTAERAAGQLAGLPGVVRFTAYAARARADVVYDPAVTGPAAIREAFEAPVHDAATGEYLFGLYTVAEVDGVKVEPESQ
jgi:hypothetical protein